MKDSDRPRHKLGDPDVREPELNERETRFETIFDQHAGRVFAYASRRSDHDTANDVVSETFLITWRRLDDVPEDALPWLLNVAGKVVANHRRSDQRRDAFAARLANGRRALSAFDPAEAVPTRLLVREALDRLPPAEREALLLVAWDGLDVRRGSLAAGCSRATFSVRLHRARRRLMKELGLSRHPRAKASPGPGGADDDTVPIEEATST
jgi:RNA polymerase sigma-70 factor (ECF subfamily)